MLNVAKIEQLMEEIAPSHLALDFDNCGLQVGSKDQPVSNILVTLDCTQDVVQEAIYKNCQLILSHHPLIFSPLRSVVSENPKEQIVIELLRHSISLFVAHTNFDIAQGGTNDVLADLFQLQNAKDIPLEQKPMLKGEISNYKNDKEEIKQALSSIAQAIDITHSKIEFVIAQAKMQQAQSILNGLCGTNALVYYSPLTSPSENIGLGKVGQIDKISLEKLAEKSKQLLNAPQVRIGGEGQKTIETLAVIGGSGASMAKAALALGADCILTGDIKYHDMQEIVEQGGSVIDAGHFATEWVAMPVLAKRLQKQLDSVNLNGNVIVSTTNRDVFTTI